MLMASIKRQDELKSVSVPLMDEYRKKVKVTTRDLLPNYALYCREFFPNAMQVADKFHIIRYAIETMQTVRIRYRQKELEKRRKAYQQFKQEQQ